MRAHHNRGVSSPGLAAPPPAVDPAAALTSGHNDEAPGWQAEGSKGQGKGDSAHSHGAMVLGQSASAGGLTISSREIAELTGKEHKNVMADIRSMLDQLSMPSAEFSANLPDSYGRPQPAYRLPKDLTLALVSGYSVQVRHRLVMRWQQLEDLREKAGKPVVPTSFREALLLAADQQEVIERQAAALAIAAPKAAGFDRIAATPEGSVSVRVVAKIVNVPAGKRIDFLIERGWLYRTRGGGHLAAKADKLRDGLAEMKRIEVEGSDRTERTVARVFITQRGLARLTRLIERDAPHLREAPHLRKARAAPTSQQGQLVLQLVSSKQEGSAP